MQFNKLIPPNELSNKDYHKSKGISASTLKNCKINPDYAIKRHLLSSVDSKALDKGICVHEYLLEPEKFSWSNYNFTPADDELLKVMTHNGEVMFSKFFNNSKNEYSIYYQDEGFIRKARLDMYFKYFDYDLIGDVKMSKCSNPKDFESEAYKLDYDLQVAWNYDILKQCGYKVDGFIFFVIPNTFPYIPFMMECTNYFIESGREKYTDILEKILKGGDYFHTLNLPSYILKNKGIIE